MNEKGKTNKRTYIVVICVVLMIIAALWFWRFNVTKAEAIIIPDVHFNSEYPVSIGDNYFWSSNEAPNGYTLSVNDVQVRETDEFLHAWNAPKNYYPMEVDGLPRSKYLYDLEITVKNENNSEGQVHFSNWLLLDKSIILRPELELTVLCEPTLKDAGSFTLPIGKERNFHFIFSADPYLVLTNSDKLYERMFQGNFSLCISQIPERRLIDLA